MKVKIQGLGSYSGKSTDKAGNIKFKIIFSYEERKTLAELLVFPGQTIRLMAKYNKMEPVTFGEFDFGGLNIDKNGQGTLTLSTEYTSFDVTKEEYLFPLEDGQQKLITFTLTADIDTSDDNDVDVDMADEVIDALKNAANEWGIIEENNNEGDSDTLVDW